MEPKLLPHELIIRWNDTYAEATLTAKGHVVIEAAILRKRVNEVLQALAEPFGVAGQADGEEGGIH